MPKAKACLAQGLRACMSITRDVRNPPPDAWKSAVRPTWSGTEHQPLVGVFRQNIWRVLVALSPPQAPRVFMFTTSLIVTPLLTTMRYRLQYLHWITPVVLNDHAHENCRSHDHTHIAGHMIMHMGIARDCVVLCIISSSPDPHML